MKCIELLVTMHIQKLQNDLRILLLGLIGMTATLPSEKEKATEILTRLRISSVAERTEDSLDVKPYIQETNTEWINVELPPELKAVQTLLKLALDERYDTLRKNGIRLAEQKSLSALLRIRQFVLNQNRRSAKPLFTAIRIHYALNISLKLMVSLLF